MAAFDFPNSPSVNDTHTENGVSFKWDGTVWKRVSGTGAQGSTGATGSQGAAGAQGDAAGITMTAGAPASPDAGTIRFNTTEGTVEGWDGGQWLNLMTPEGGATTGGSGAGAGKTEKIESSAACMTALRYTM